MRLAPWRAVERRVAEEAELQEAEQRAAVRLNQLVATAFGWAEPVP